MSPIFHADEEKLSKCAKNIIYIEKLEEEVNHGGFGNYFFYNSGNYAMETREALRDIGSTIFFDIVTNAIQIFPNGIVPKELDERQAVLNDIETKNSDVWEELNNKFMKYEEDIYSLLIDYINKNINEF